MSRDEVLNKIRKLHNLANGRNATPGEAAAAAAKVQALLFEHRLTMFEVEKAGQGADDPYAVHSSREADGVDKLGGPKNVRKQLQFLACTIARYNFCTGLLSGDRVTIVGRQADVEVVWWLYAYLRDELLRQARLSAAENHQSNPYPWIRAFLLGADREIGRRLSEQREANRRATSESQALVLVSDAALKQAVEKFFPKLGRARGSNLGNWNGMAAGRAAGRTISLNRPIGAGRTAGRLGA